MKRLLLMLAVLLGSLGTVKAQDGLDGPDDNKKKEKIEALYVAFITKELNLTATEAQQFWPVHAEFNREVMAVKGDMPELDRQQSILNIKKRFQDRFVKIINADRTDRFFRKDTEFRRKLAERLRQIRQNRQNRQDAPPRFKRGS